MTENLALSEREREIERGRERRVEVEMDGGRGGDGIERRGRKKGDGRRERVSQVVGEHRCCQWLSRLRFEVLCVTGQQVREARTAFFKNGIYCGIFPNVSMSMYVDRLKTFVHIGRNCGVQWRGY